MSLLTLPIEFLHERLEYDPASGELRWKRRPSSNPWNARFAGKIAGRPSSRGYLHIDLTHLNRQRHYQAHRIAFAMAYGRWPDAEIDHKNRVKLDNRLENLREATRIQNSQNQKKSVSNTTGHTGVYRTGRRWFAQIHADGKRKFLGCFANKEEAGRAYLAAKRQFHPFATLGG
jgi:HNH endonuclease